MHGNIGDVAMHEHLSRQKAHDLVGWYAAVRAADAHVAR